MQIESVVNYFLSNDEGSNNLRLESHLDFLKSNTVYYKTEEKIDNMSDEDAMQLIKEQFNQISAQNNYEPPIPVLYEITKSTEPNETENQKKSLIFDIKKVNKNKGRRKQSHPELYKEDAVHTKFREDNVINKIKIYFINSTMSLINKKYSEYLKAKPGKRLLQKIKPNYSKIYKKKETQEFFNKKLSIIFSEELSGRCSTFENKKNYNKIQIDNLIEKNKVNIYDIPISLITEQYMAYIDAMTEAQMQMDTMSEFLVMAATLLDIKARMLLPKQQDLR